MGRPRIHEHIGTGRERGEIGIDDPRGNPGAGPHQIEPLPERVIGIIKCLKIDPGRIDEIFFADIAVSFSRARAACEIDTIAQLDQRRRGRIIRGIGRADLVAVARSITNHVTGDGHADRGANADLAHGKGGGGGQNIGTDLAFA